MRNNAAKSTENRARLMATTISGCRTAYLAPFENIQPFPDDVLVLLMVQVISDWRFARKISCLGA
jgi:hypothetical protein